LFELQQGPFRWPDDLFARAEYPAQSEARYYFTCKSARSSFHAKRASATAVPPFSINV
jgi:hypothetical protein